MSSPFWAMVNEAEQQARLAVRMAQRRIAWDTLEVRTVLRGSFRFVSAGGGPGVAEVLGDMRNVLNAKIGR